MEFLLFIFILSYSSMSLKFVGPDPGYGFTSIGIVAAARTLLDDKLINNGGLFLVIEF